MKGPEHYREAESLLAQARIPARERAVPNWLTAEETIALAQVHATLALAAATAANIRRNGAVNRANVDVDPAAGWPEVLG